MDRTRPTPASRSCPCLPETSTSPTSVWRSELFRLMHTALAIGPSPRRSRALDCAIPEILRDFDYRVVVLLPDSALQRSPPVGMSRCAMAVRLNQEKGNPMASLGAM